MHRRPVRPPDARLHSRPWEPPSRWSRLPWPSSPGRRSPPRCGSGTPAASSTSSRSTSWATPRAGRSTDPPVVSLFPGAEGTAKLVLRAAARWRRRPPGVVPYALRARSREDPAGSAVEEGTITVGAFAEPFTELAPRTSRGSRAGTHDLAIDNRGNARLNAGVEGTDADRQLKFDIKPPGVVVEPGMAGFAKVRVSPVKRFWRGQPKTRPFQLFVTPEGGAADHRRRHAAPGVRAPAVVPEGAARADRAADRPRPDLVAAAQAAPSTPPSPTPSRRRSRASRRTSTTPSVRPACRRSRPQPAPAVAAAAPHPRRPAPRAARRRAVVPHRPAPSGVAHRHHPGPRQPDRRPPRHEQPGVHAHRHAVHHRLRVLEPERAPRARSTVSRNDTPLLSLQLANFRDYDLHFVTPIVIGPGEQLNAQRELHQRRSVRPVAVLLGVPAALRPEARRVAAVALGLALLIPAPSGPPPVGRRGTDPARSCRRRTSRADPARRTPRCPPPPGSTDPRLAAGRRWLPEQLVRRAVDLRRRPVRRVRVVGLRTSSAAPPGTAPVPAVFVRDRQKGKTSRLPLPPGFAGGGSAREPSISADGSVVAFTYQAPAGFTSVGLDRARVGPAGPAGPRWCRATRRAARRAGAASRRSRRPGGSSRSRRTTRTSSRATATTRTCSDTTGARGRRGRSRSASAAA